MSGNFPPDFFAPEYFAPEYFGGEADSNAIAASISGTATVTATLENGAVVVEVRRQVGGSWVNPTYVKDRKRKRKGVSDDYVRDLYERIVEGKQPETRKAVRAVAKAVEAVKPYTEEVEAVPAAVAVDWAAVSANTKAVAALKAALAALEDEDEALIALLMAA